MLWQNCDRLWRFLFQISVLCDTVTFCVNMSALPMYKKQLLKRGNKCLSSVFFMVRDYCTFFSTIGKFLFATRIRLTGLVSAIYFS